MTAFVDTSAWLALNDKNDQYYKNALIKGHQIKRRKLELVTSEYIFDESITLLRYRVSHQSAVAFGESLLNSSIVKIIGVTSEDRLMAWEMFKQYRDKELSFTDCTSFVLMKRLKLQKAFAFDKHFRIMGFEML